MLQRPHAPHGETPGRCSSENTELLFKTMCRKKEKKQECKQVLCNQQLRHELEPHVALYSSPSVIVHFQGTGAMRRPLCTTEHSLLNVSPCGDATQLLEISFPVGEGSFLNLTRSCVRVCVPLLVESGGEAAAGLTKCRHVEEAWCAGTRGSQGEASAVGAGFRQPCPLHHLWVGCWPLDKATWDGWWSLCQLVQHRPWACPRRGWR